MRNLTRVLLPPAMVLVAATLLFEFVVRVGWVREFLVPAPSQVLGAMREFAGTFAFAAGQTASAAALGFVFSSAIGLILAIVLSSGGWVQRAFYPYAVLFQTVPIVAIAPLLAIWFGFDWKAVVAASFIVSIFPVIVNTLSGLISTDPALRDLFRLYGAGAGATLMKLRLPFALPQIFTGLRIAAGLAVVGAIVGEFITGTGLGGLIPTFRQRQRVDAVFAILLISALLGIALFALVSLISRLALRHWHASEKQP